MSGGARMFPIGPMDLKRMDKTPKGNRLHIVLFGWTNVGKSRLLNMIAGQDGRHHQPGNRRSFPDRKL